MKNTTSIILRYLLACLLVAAIGNAAIGQDDEPANDTRPVKNMFDGNWLIDNQTAIISYKGTFTFDIQHRFGTVENGLDDLYGLYAPSNIRLGFGYVPIDKLMVGFGLTKFNMMLDFSAKYALLQQGRSGGSPVNLTYYVNMGIDTRDMEKTPYLNSSDRYSYFHQLMVARKVTDNFSMQVAGSLSHFNMVEAFITSGEEIEGKMENDHIAVSVSGRYKVASAINIIANYDQPITEHKTNNPNPNISFGLEMVSSSHQFQVFVGNYANIVPQRNNMFNRNDFGDGEILIGFNIIRLWNF